MENEIINEEQPAPIIEKVSLEDLDQERVMLDLEEDNLVNNLIKSMLALNNDELTKAIDYLDKKIEILKKLKNITWRYATSNRNSKLSHDGTVAKFTSTKVGTYTVTLIVDEFKTECTVNVVENTSTDLNSVEASQQTGKYIKDGQLLIHHQGQIINALGQTIK